MYLSSYWTTIGFEDSISLFKDISSSNSAPEMLVGRGGDEDEDVDGRVAVDDEGREDDVG